MAARQLPKTMRKIVALKFSPQFRECTKITEVPLPTPGPEEVLVRNRYVGVNASDINFTAGRYDQKLTLPFDTGFEGIGEVVGVGDKSKLKIGQTVIYLSYGAFSEYKTVKNVIPLPCLKAELLPLILSGLTASISLDKVGEIKSGETVLVTAAAGGTGQFAVQWAKNAGCHVIGTCSSDEKVDFLKSIGCDRPINYKTEVLRDVLKAEYPKGIDVIYESVGGEMFDTCVDSLALKGRLIIIGYISGYETKKGFTPSRLATLPQKLLPIAASVRGFFLFHYNKDFIEYMMKLTQLLDENKIMSVVDTGESVKPGGFRGLDDIADAIDYMYSGKNKGKIIVELPEKLNGQL